MDSSKLGVLYLISVILDGLLSVAATLFSPLEPVSSLLSSLLLLASIAVLVFALLDRLLPKGVFIAVSATYIAVASFGLVVGVALVAKLGPEGIENVSSEQMDLAFIAETLPWYMPVHWALIVTVLLSGVLGLAIRLRGSGTKPRPRMTRPMPRTMPRTAPRPRGRR